MFKNPLYLLLLTIATIWTPAVSVAPLRAADTSAANPGGASPRQRLLLDFGWKFKFKDPAGVGDLFYYSEVPRLDKATAADDERDATMATTRPDAAAVNLGADVEYVKSDFSDSDWRSLDLPHDWAVEQPFDRQTNNNEGSKAVGEKFGTNIGWYRRGFDLPAADKDKALWLEFDGVFRNCLVWLNGHCLGRNVSGYSSFSYDINKYANFGGRNVLVVRVDASRTEGWFYEGAGIYRHAWLVKAPPGHIAHWGVYVSSEMDGADSRTTVQTDLVNETDKPLEYNLRSTVLDARGMRVSEANKSVVVEPHKTQTVSQSVYITDAKRWSLQTPYLYQMVSKLIIRGDIVDQITTPFGVRTLEWDPNKGFSLNGQHVELQGTCNHQDHAGVGSALPDRLQYFRIEKLKEMGANAYRTSHNDPTPELLDACDRLGILVLDEHRKMGKSPEILGQLDRLIRRDRNHPCVFAWSVGNEEQGIQGTDYGASAAQTMQDVVHKLDPSRKVTVAMNGKWGTGISTVIDLQGYNYIKGGDMDAFHKDFPAKPGFATEEASTLCTRGQYADDRARGFVQAYDLDAPRWGSTAEKSWTYYLARPWNAGEFVWTGFDYRGEPNPYKWPNISSQFGIMDTCGFPKDIYYYYQANWADKPVLHIFPHWNWPGMEGKEIDVWCFSNYDEVELFLNGKTQGRQKVDKTGHESWKVKYAPGTLLAKAFRDGKEAAQEKIETTGPAASVKLIADRPTINADGVDLSILTVEVLDAQGRVVPTADNEIIFQAIGGKIIGVGNGDPTSHEEDKATHRKAFNGLAQVIVQTDRQAGELTISGKSTDLTPASIIVHKAAATPPAEP
jgi:beta-galactosidase